MPTVSNETQNRAVGNSDGSAKRATSPKTAAATFARQTKKTEDLAVELRHRFCFLTDMWIRVLYRVVAQELQKRGYDPVEELYRH